ncbi:hypothetical protein D3C78_997260 [compost metagenome]
MIEQRHVGLRAAALGNLPGRHQVGAVELGHRVETQFRPRGAGGRGGHLDLVLDPHVGQRRIHQYRGLAGIAAYHQANALQVDQQRVRADQERLVVVAAIVIEHRQLRSVEIAAVEHQVASDFLHAVGTQVAHQQPEPFQVQLGVAATLEVQVAVEHAVLQLAVGIELSLPLVGRTKHLQCRVGREQLHGRRRVHRNVGVEVSRIAGAVERDHYQRQRIVGQLAGLEGLFDSVRQGRIDLGQRWYGEWQQRGKGYGAQGLEHF